MVSLEEVVLEHVPDDARLFVVAPAVLDPDRLGGGDLDVMDVLAVPDGFEDRVREAEHEEVLHRLFAEVMVDAVDLVLGEGAPHDRVQGASSGSRLRLNRAFRGQSASRGGRWTSGTCGIAVRSPRACVMMKSGSQREHGEVEEMAALGV